MAGTSPAMTKGASRQKLRPSKPLYRLAHVLDMRRLRETMADQLAPFGEIGRAAEIVGVVLDRPPLHEQAVAVRQLDRALELHAGAALCALEKRRRLLHAALEFRFHAGLDVDLRDFEDHGVFLQRLRILSRHAPRKRGIQYSMASNGPGILHAIDTAYWIARFRGQ